MSSSLQQAVLRKIPKVDDLLARPEIVDLLAVHPRTVVVEAIRKGLSQFRQDLVRRLASSPVDDSVFSFETLLPLFLQQISNQIQLRLRRVINATGVVIHTNLGRSPLHPSALQHIVDVSKAYSNLEFDLDRGERGTRYAHVEDVLCRISGAEAAMVVNNNAAAVLLVLNTIAEGKEVIVSRGELVEIGGAFRIPDVMKRSGALLREVGTTNRTHLGDYQKAISSETALLLKVHTSNFRVMGFTSDVPLEELVLFGRKVEIPVVNDLGSGSLVDLSNYGMEKEPTVQEVVRSGVDAVTFSGDKLLGGPQAGIILGKKNIIDLIKMNPLTRALRIDKLTLAALESTLVLFLDEKKAMEEVPTLRMLTLDKRQLKQRGRKLLNRVAKGVGEEATLTLREDRSQVGGGALPLQDLPTIALTVRPHAFSVNHLEEVLRKGELPVIARISRDELILDMRTIFDEEIPLLARCVIRALKTMSRE
jgi:L-seryl-tRNA(Ser) seleniumtransferase